MNATISLDELIALIREHQGISGKKEITESSLLEKDLGISGDDGGELIEAIEKKFNLSFAGADGSLSKAFGLSEGQYLFHGEVNLLGVFVRPENVKEITVGELYLAACKAKEHVHA
jgi:acyl carrier protein